MATVSPSIYGNPPASNKSGSFPREYIAKDETVIFETRPSIAAFLKIGRIVGVIIGAIIFSLIVTAITSAINASYYVSAAARSNAIAAFYSGLGFYVPLFLFVILPVLSLAIGSVTGILSWRNTAYAITDRRTMQSRGIFSRNTNDCAHDKIQSVNLHQGVLARMLGYGSISYLTAGTSVDVKKEQAVISTGGVFWTGTRDPVNTRRYVQEVVDKARQEMKVKEFQSMAAVLRQQGATVTPGATLTPGAATTPTVASPVRPAGRFCSSCGSQLDLNSKFCKSCGAQVLVEA